MSDITTMMIARDNLTLNLPPLTATNPTAYEISHHLRYLPEALQPILSSDADKVSAFLPTFFTKIQSSLSDPQKENFCYKYTLYLKQRSHVLSMVLPQAPATANDFFTLALAIYHRLPYQGVNVSVFDNQDNEVSERIRNSFVYSLLQNAAVCRHEQAQQALTEIQQQRQLFPSYPCCSHFDFIFNYRDTSNFILLNNAVKTPVQFFELANDPSLNTRLFIFSNQHVLPGNVAQLNELICGLLNDAARAGCVAAKDQLIEKTIAGSAIARQYVTFAYHNPELPILLPRLFASSQDFCKLSVSLLTHGKHFPAGSGQLTGPFYILPNGTMAEKLGYMLHDRANEMKNVEDKLAKSITELKQDEKESMVEQLPAAIIPVPAPASISESKSLNSVPVHFGSNSVFFFNEGHTNCAEQDAPSVAKPLHSIKSF